MSSGGAEDDIPQAERKTVTDFCYLLDKSKQLFNGLRLVDFWSVPSEKPWNTLQCVMLKSVNISNPKPVSFFRGEQCTTVWVLLDLVCRNVCRSRGSS